MNISFFKLNIFPARYDQYPCLDDASCELIASIKELEDKLPYPIDITEKEAAASLISHIKEKKIQTAQPEETLGLFDHISAKCVLFTSFIEANFFKFFHLSANLTERLQLCERIASWNHNAAKNLVINVEKLGIESADPADKLKLAETIISQGEDAATALASNYEKFGLAEIDPTKLINLCLTIMSISKFGARELLLKVERLGLDKMDLNSRIDFLKEIVSVLNDLPTYKILGGTLKNFGFRDAPLEVRLNLCRSMISSGKYSACCVAEHFDVFGLQNEDLDLRLELCNAIISLGEIAALGVPSGFEKFGLEKLDPTDRFLLCKRIVEQGALAARAIITNAHKFRIKKFDPSQRIDLCFTIVSQSEWNAQFFISSCEKFGLKDVDSHALFPLCDCLFSQTPSLRWAVLEDEVFAGLISKLNFLDRLSLAKTIFSKSPAEAMEYYKKLALSLEDIEEWILSSPEAALSDSALLLYFPKKMINQAILELPANGYQMPSSRLRSLDIKQHPVLSVMAPILNKTGITTAAESEAMQELLRERHKFSSLELLYHRALKAKNEKAKASLTAWIAYAASVLSDLGEVHVKAINNSGLLDLIFEYQSPSDRYALLRNLSFMAVKEPQNLAALNNEQKGWTQLASILISRLTKWGLSMDQRETLLRAIDVQREFKDTQKSKILFQFLFCIIDHEPYTKDQIAAICRLAGEVLEKPVKKNDKQQISDIDNALRSLACFSNVLQLFGKKKFLESNQSPESFFQEEFKTLFPINIKDISGRYQNTFAKFRKPEALFTYMRRLMLLKQPDKSEVFTALTTYVSSVLEETFPESRYRIEESLHLKKVFHDERLKHAWIYGSAPKQVIIGNTGNAPREYSVLEIDNPCDLLLIGTEVNGSCLKVGGDPDLNKCLLSYLLHGDIRPVAIKDNSGRIVARCILRLMWDEEGKTPVLLMERIYSNINEPFVNVTINSWAKERAKQLGIPLVSKEIKTDEFYKGTLGFLGGPAPFSYCDAAGGVMEGAFTVEGCHLL